MEPGQMAYKASCAGPYPLIDWGPWSTLDQEEKDGWARVEAAIRADENAKATAIERERCAKVAERFGSKPAPASDGGTRILQAVDGHQVADAIRAGEKPANPSQSPETTKPAADEGDERGIKA